MEKFEILLTITTEKRLTVMAPSAEVACNIAEAVALSTNILDEAEDVCKDAIAEVLEEAAEDFCCEDCDCYCPTCEECNLLECNRVQV